MIARPVGTLPISVTLRNQCLSASRTARNHAQYARRQDAVDELHHAIGRKRRLIRRLRDHAVARRERRTKFPGSEHDRMVVRDDACHDPQRLAHRHVHHPFAHRNRFAFDLGRETGEVLDLRRGDNCVSQHFLDRIAAVRGIEERELFGICAQHGC
jgi:hypothetical protein